MNAHTFVQPCGALGSQFTHLLFGFAVSCLVPPTHGIEGQLHRACAIGHYFTSLPELRSTAHIVGLLNPVESARANALSTD